MIKRWTLLETARSICDGFPLLHLIDESGELGRLRTKT